MNSIALRRSSTCPGCLSPWFVVAYVPAASSVGEALRLLDLPDEDYGWIQITVSPDSDHVIFVERTSNCKACPSTTIESASLEK
jgi:hypothetical protein